MAKKQSAGILLYRMVGNDPEVFLIHPGGPFYVKKDDGVWSIPKGEFETEDPLDAARREFHEETGSSVTGEFKALTPLKIRSGKLVYAWAVEGDIDAASVKSNLFSMEWPPRSGKQQSFPEADRGGWFKMPAAREKIRVGQRGFLDELEKMLGNNN